MLNKFKNFSKSKLGAVVVFIVALPFVFFGMGSVFQNKDTNNIAKIDNFNISTKNFTNHVSSLGISSEVIRNNLDQNILEEILSDLLAKKFIELEIDYYNLSISDEHLVKIIKNNKNFLDDKSQFDRIKYEKFLIENNVNASDFEKRLKNRELEKKLFFLLNGGIVTPEFVVKKYYKYENSKINLRFINLDNFYKKKDQLNETDIVNYIQNNTNDLQRDFIDFDYIKITPKNLIGVDEYNEVFFSEIDNIENNISNFSDLKSLLNNYENINIDKKINYTLVNNDDPFKEIYENRFDSGIQIMDKNDYILLFQINNIENKIPEKTDESFRNFILTSIVEKEKFDYNKKIFEKINTNKFSDTDFENISNDKSLFKNIKLNSVKDNNFFNINSVEYIYSLPEKSFLLTSDEKGKIYLAKIDKIITKNIDNKKKDFDAYHDKTQEKLKSDIFSTYDLYLNNKYNVKIYSRTIERLRNYFK
ncbi:MAG: SurA N-terminal domain-containing protein [Candidatus Pelagibacter sp.]